MAKGALATHEGWQKLYKTLPVIAPVTSTPQFRYFTPEERVAGRRGLDFQSDLSPPAREENLDDDLVDGSTQISPPLCGSGGAA